MPNLTDNQLEAARVSIEKRAAMEGVSPDEYVSKRFAWIESGDDLGKAQFFQKESIKYQISELFDSALSKKDNTVRKIEIGELSASEVETIKQAIGLDVSGYKRTISNYEIRHALKEHGNAAKEEARGQIAITKDDIIKIPEIVTSYDKIEPAGKSKKGLETIAYTKKENGHVYVVEEVRTGKNELSFLSMRKYKSPASNALPEGSPSLTSETLRGLDNSNLPPSDDSVNRLEQAHNKEAKGAVQFLEDGRAVIHAFEKADISTVMHELAHVWRRDITGDDLRCKPLSCFVSCYSSLVYLTDDIQCLLIRHLKTEGIHIFVHLLKKIGHVELKNSVFPSILRHIRSAIFCFNPCFIGSIFQTPWFRAFPMLQLKVSILVLLEVSFRLNEDSPDAPGVYRVSILVLLEVSFRRRVRGETYTPLHQFQSLFYWKYLSDILLANALMRIRMFQSLFYWKYLSDT